jgi:hypothetical protein
MAAILPPSDGTFVHTAHLCYLGALLALGVPNLDVAANLAKVTRTEDELVQAIARLRAATRAEDRVWPVLNWLRELRRLSDPADVALRQTVIVCNGPPIDGATIPSPPPSEEET